MDGEHGKSAYLWLVAMDRGRVEGTSPSMYLKHIDRHIEGEAAQWVLNTESVRVLIYREYLELATESDIEAFHGALTERFKLTEEEARDKFKAMPLVRLLKLRQRASEGLEEYHYRARLVLLDLHGDDGENDALTPLQQSLRSITVERFASDLRDDWPSSGTRFGTRLLQQQILHDTVSLNEAFKMAEAVSKRMNPEREREDGKKKQQEKKKRKLAPELEGPGHAKKQKPRLKLKFPLIVKPGIPELERSDHAKKQESRLTLKFPSTVKPGIPELEGPDHAKKQKPRLKLRFPPTAKPGVPELEGSDHAKEQRPRLELKFPSAAKPRVPELEGPDHAKKQWPRLKANFQSSAKPGVVLPEFRLKTRLRDWTVG